MSDAEKLPAVAWVDRKKYPPGTKLNVYLNTWEDFIESLIEDGLPDDEIVDAFEHPGAGQPPEGMLSRTGEYIYFGALHGRRKVLALLAEARGPVTAAATVLRRSRTLADPRAVWEAAIVAIRSRHGRLTKAAVATEMGIDRGTLDTYIKAKLVPPFPW